MTQHSSPVSEELVFERIQTPRGWRPVPPPDCRNLVMTISYDGRAFQGYQFQPHAKTVQEMLNKAWKILTRENVLLFGCSRLDAGVSASHYVLNFYSRSQLDTDTMVRKLNGIFQMELREPIAVYSIVDAAPMFHARYDTVGKHYRYLMWYGRGQHALLIRRGWNLRSRQAPTELLPIMQAYRGTHDFAAFRSQDCTAKTTTRTLLNVDVWQHPRYSDLTVLDFWGDGFLKNMVRNMVGTAVDISTGKLPADTIEKAFAHCDRTKIGQCAPAHGLTLERVYYEEAEFQKESEGLRFLLS